MHILICCRQISKTAPNNIAHLHILIVYKHLHIKDHCWNTTCLHVSNEYLREAGKLRVLQRLDEEVLSQRVLVDPFQTFLFCAKWTKFTSQFNLTHFSYLLPSISYQIYINKKGLKKKKKKYFSWWNGQNVWLSRKRTCVRVQFFNHFLDSS